MKKIVKKGEYSNKHSDRNILGSFIESGFGRQVPGMWAEMIYNRSFRKTPDYKWPLYTWIGVDKEHYNSNAPFWHSGYEENDWYTIGASILTNPLGEETHKGYQSLMVENRDGAVCGVAQDGIHLKKGESYIFRVFCGSVVSRLNSDNTLKGFGMNVRSNITKAITVELGDNVTEIDVYGDPQEFRWSFVAQKTEVCTLKIQFNWQGKLILGFTSLMPENNLRGWRKDAIEKICEAAPSVIRFPGGCFTSFHDWRASVGPRDRREPEESFYWGGWEENDVGLAEFMDLCQLCDITPHICFNMLTSTPFDARCMVEYLNAPADVGYGRQRMLDGYEQPWNVELFECDNEAYRKLNYFQYAHECVAFIKEMRLASPNAKFIMITYGYGLDKLPEMLDIAGPYIDYITDRDSEPEHVEKVLQVLKTYNEKHGSSIRLTNTEWFPSAKSPEPFEVAGMDMDFEWNASITNDYNKTICRHELSWNYALNCAHRILDYVTYGGEFAIANFNNLANTYGQNLIELSKETAWLSCTGEIFAFFKRNFNPCFGALADTGERNVFAVFAQELDGKEKIFIVNHSSQEYTYDVPMSFTKIVDGLTANQRAGYVTANCSPITKLQAQPIDKQIKILPLSIICIE